MGEMKLFIIRSEDGYGFGYDAFHGHIIRAENVEQARSIASKKCADEGSGVWLDENKTTCEELKTEGDQGMSIGFSIGSATRDNDCVIFQTAAMVGNDPAMKTALMCQIPEYKTAMESIGRSCPSVAPKNDQVASAKVWNQKPLVGGRPE